MFELIDTLWLFRSSARDSLHTKEKKLLFSNMILVLTVSVCVHYIADFSALTYSVFSSRCENAAHIPPGVISSPPHPAACLSVLKPDIKKIKIKEKTHTHTDFSQSICFLHCSVCGKMLNPALYKPPAKYRDKRTLFGGLKQKEQTNHRKRKTEKPNKNGLNLLDT